MVVDLIVPVTDKSRTHTLAVEIGKADAARLAWLWVLHKVIVTLTVTYILKLLVCWGTAWALTLGFGKLHEYLGDFMIEFWDNRVLGPYRDYRNKACRNMLNDSVHVELALLDKELNTGPVVWKRIGKLEPIDG